tara:strand:- start:59 stop:415 length:357 start_codon:yes stop_codon:yes gene_type:complete
MKIHPYIYVGCIEHTKKIIKPEIALDHILDILNNVNGTTKKEIIGQSRKRHLVEARQICFYILRKHYDLTFKRIGELFDNRDHSTILHGCERHRDDYKYCYEYSKKFDYVINQHSALW